MPAPKKYTQETILEAVKGSGAIVSTVARRLQCEWITAKRYIEKWEATQRAFQDEEETILDMAESKLYEAIQNNDIQAAKWILSTKGKSRGYSERQELQHSGPGGSMLTVKWIDAGTGD